MLSSVMKIIPARCVKRLAYEAGRFVIEIGLIYLVRTAEQSPCVSPPLSAARTLSLSSRASPS